jgi:hypothetical protein
MTAVIAGALIAALVLAGALAAMLFWQSKRAAKAMDRALEITTSNADLKILKAAAEVAIADKDRALNIVTAERDRLKSTIDTVTEQRDALLKESLEHATPGTVATSVRDALERLRAFPPKLPEAEGVPDVPGG